jgi:hypothetical protein
MLSVILTGWKQISRHLGYGIRTAQRWENRGLPVKRVTNGPRSPVVADSEELDAWILRGKDLPPGAPLDLLRNIERARELCAEVERARTALREKMANLRKGMAELRTRSRR